MDVIIDSLLEQGIPYLILSFAVPFATSFIIYCFMRKLLPTRMNVYALLGLALVYTLWYNLVIPELIGTRYHLWMNIFINAWQYFIILFLFQGMFLKKLIVWWYFDIIKTMCQAVAYVPVLLYQMNTGTSREWAQIVSSVGTDAAMKLLHTATLIPLFILLGSLSLAIWRKILMEKFQPFYLIFIFLPMGFRYSLSNVIQPSMGDWFFGILINFVDEVSTAYNILSLAGIFTSLIASIAIFYYILSHDKRVAIETELAETKLLMDLEQARFADMERRGEELARIRHDFNNQLSSITALVQTGEDSTAWEIICKLKSEINGD